MSLQRRLLHAILALLGLAAVAGVSTIFLPGGEFVFRIAGTLVLAAVAIGLTIPASKRLARQEDRTRGLIAMLADVVGFCLWLSAIWLEFLFSRLDWDLTLTTLAYVAAVVPGLAFLAIAARPQGRIAGSAGIALCAATFVSWMLAIWGSHFGAWPADDWAGTAGIFAVAALPVVANLFGTLQSGRHWRFLGALAAATGVALGLIGIWSHAGGMPTSIVHSFIVAGVIGGANVLVRLPLPPVQNWLRLATTGMLLVTGVLGMIVNQLASDGRFRSFDEIDVRLLTAACVVTSCGILAIAVLMAFNRRFVVTQAHSIAEIKSIAVVCPRCATKFNAGRGQSNCTGCNLILLIQVAEPRCRTCNYNLLDLRADKCPECGAPVAGSLAAVGAGTS
ncbi:MAG: hypothetical protein AABZ53_12800 [Planctomycetota bacterium]